MLWTTMNNIYNISDVIRSRITFYLTFLYTFFLTFSLSFFFPYWPWFSGFGLHDLIAKIIKNKVPIPDPRVPESPSSRVRFLRILASDRQEGAGSQAFFFLQIQTFHIFVLFVDRYSRREKLWEDGLINISLYIYVD